jgi:uncharacterized membrane protein (UPF0127 family)/CheY-like chemotaxis protein
VSEPSKLIVNLTRGNVLGEHIVIADTPLSRMRGVLGRQPLKPGHGFLLQPAPSIHTAFVRFQFDAVFLDMNLQVVRVVHRVKPWRLASARRAAMVLELAAGEAERRKVRVGDQIVISDIVDDLLPAPPEVDRGTRPARLLLIGADRRFRSTAAILLERRGYEVQVSERPTGLAEQAREAMADVVVIDAGSLPAVTALEVVRLDALRPAVGYVMVSDDAARPARVISTVPKWGSVDDLSEAIEGALSGTAAAS